MNPQQSSLSIPIAIIIAGALIAGAVYFSNVSGGGVANTGGNQPAQPKVDIKDVKITASDPFIGDPKAPVTIAYWSDYQCPFCKAVEVGGVPGINITESIPTLITDYVNTGKVRIVFKDFPFLGQDSITAALYEHAIWETYPDKFYDWREAMFKAQDDEGDQGFGDEESILALIKTIPGMDANALKAKVAANTDEYTDLINADREEGSALGVSGTPSFITGKTFIPGAVGLSTFTAAIDAQLK